MIDFRTHPSRYRHWRLELDAGSRGDQIARLGMDVDSEGGLGDYELKLNSYDLGVDIELADAVQRLRFEHPEVGAVVIGSLKERVFCAGANISMLAGSSHATKVNFCKFTNETRNAIEDASAHSGQRYLAAINGTAAGGGYEMALATDHIMLVDDGSATVALPEVPLLAVLPGTGGLTRLVDKRKVRRDLADVFCTTEEGVKGTRAVEWGLVDEVVPRSRFNQVVAERAAAMASGSDRPTDAAGVTLTVVERELGAETLRYRTVTVDLDKAMGTAAITVQGPDTEPPTEPDGLSDRSWLLAMLRDLDDAVLHLRTNEPEIGTWLLRTAGDPDGVLTHDRWLHSYQDHWAAREVALYAARLFRRMDVTARSMFALIEPGSCFAGILAELAFVADRSYMADGSLAAVGGRDARLVLTGSNLGMLPTDAGLTRLATRFGGDAPEGLRTDVALDAVAAEEAGLVTYAYDDIDWGDEIRLALEERAGFSPDALTGLEANLRFAGPETKETKIFGRLTAWQNWVFTRPNASGDTGALRRYGTGRRPDFDRRRT